MAAKAKSITNFGSEKTNSITHLCRSERSPKMAQGQQANGGKSDREEEEMGGNFRAFNLQQMDWGKRCRTGSSRDSTSPNRRHCSLLLEGAAQEGASGNLYSLSKGQTDGIIEGYKCRKGRGMEEKVGENEEAKEGRG